MGKEEFDQTNPISCHDISIVTVCYNAEKVIEKTIQSVLSQVDLRFEYLIVDGNSTDNTLNLVRNYESAFQKKNIEFRMISEEDSGIYDAMNKGAREAKGRWVLYLNAGDYLYYEKCLADVAEQMRDLNADIVYGDALYHYYSLYRPFHAKKIEEILKGYVFCHQSLLTRREILINKKYSMCYPICADYEFYLRCYQEGKIFHRISIPISVYNCEGFSARNFNMDSRLERLKVRLDKGLISKRVYFWQSFRCVLFRFLPGFLERKMPPAFVRRMIRPVLKRRGWSERFIEYKDFYHES